MKFRYGQCVRDLGYEGTRLRELCRHLIFPAPGQEEAWFNANHERLTELGLS
ncbi:hypothetical protein [Mycobacteroides salmoniphilum]|uniref:hypothetical protein n=1 Tax=Mycobacteroides salmoniphilum TaxID=404941 RepID=UPI0010C48560|nr:hypothetical protein [Mycobacteroides salmoniphilum]QCH24385.1 hypothetical protein DSM43276_02648 [Mycobacteroides salmoniphilum]